MLKLYFFINYYGLSSHSNATLFTEKNSIDVRQLIVHNLYVQLKS
jgi:hypothetical protein